MKTKERNKAKKWKLLKSSKNDTRTAVPTAVFFMPVIYSSKLPLTQKAGAVTAVFTKFMVMQNGKSFTSLFNNAAHKGNFLLLTILLMAAAGNLSAQAVSFSHINTSNGLSENNVHSLAVDKNGFLWMGTVDGLNVYDGYTVTTYRREDKPQMASNVVIHLTCDSKNRIWMGTADGITWVDEKRNFHRVLLNDSIASFASRTIMDTKAYGPVLFTSLGQYYFNNKQQKWVKLDWIPEKLQYNMFHDAEQFDEDRIIYAIDSLVLILDYAQHKIVYEQSFPDVYSLCRYSDHELALGPLGGPVQIVNIETHQVVKEYPVTSELNGKTIHASIAEIRRAVNGDLLVGTGYSGLIIIDKSGKLSRYTHDPINPYSICSNITWRVLGSSNGDMIVGTSASGVSVFNIYNKEAGYTRIFGDGKGQFYDNFITNIAQDKKGNIWMGALERLIKWNKKTNKAEFYFYYSPHRLESGAQNIEIRSLCIDQQQRVWVATIGDGIAILNEASGKFTKIPLDTTLGPALATNNVLALYTAHDGTIWAGSTAGMYTIDPKTLRMNAFKTHPLLHALAGTRVNEFMEDSDGNLWIATHNGLYRYNSQAQTLQQFSTADGLAANRCLVLYQDKQGCIYTGTGDGFSIITKQGKISSYNRSNGLLYDYCAGFLQDSTGHIWIANGKCIIDFDPDSGQMQYYDENVGLSKEGFRPSSCLMTSEGEMLWGSRSGLNYFFPQQLAKHTSGIKVSIYEMDKGDSILHLAGNEHVSLSYGDNSVLFRFTAINLKGSRGIRYSYMLTGYDKQWQTGTDIREARYSSLPAGNYSFLVKASIDGINWINAGNNVSISIVSPIWQQWWFITAAVLLLGVAVWWFVRNRNRTIQKQREALETEQAINYFATSISEQQTVDSILWDVARNCIGRLQFEDCVIYLMDAERKVLQQKAAYGPKSPRQMVIDNPIEIPLGKGIVGSVGQSGMAELIYDTTLDSRYIVDDEQRYSEISVPILSGGKVLGVIDCEHSKKRFFTPRHLSILTTIASLCANKIVKATAEAEKREAEQVLMTTKQKMADVEMQALRAQMNPHFIFNCLNSINRYIVKSDQATASLYLTRFAKLIRLILDNSNSKNITLANELEALKLYIDMEALRFDKKFTYQITVDNNIHTDSVELPPLIIQPYVENAIWHGLLHKEAGGHLHIHVSLQQENMLVCEIEDNGVGRERAKDLRSKSATSRKSLGMKLTEDRLALLNKHAALSASIGIIDLVSASGEPAGTKVILKIPV
ncbi:MAG TPA: two-component regulator propeller domain-containing protein [Chitinophagaceae bacterium]|nr:two-component regulator propeller domain-containing protein [Chitinophagaceae bacterium]